MTTRQQQVLGLLANSVTIKEIAKKLNITDHTVYYHRERIMKETRLFSIAELTRLAIRLRMVKL